MDRHMAIFIGALAISCSARAGSPAAADERTVVSARAERVGAQVIVTFDVGPAHTGLDDITYSGARSRLLEVRAAGQRVVPLAERFAGTLEGGRVVITLPDLPDVRELELAGAIVVLNVDGTDLERVDVPPTVTVTTAPQSLR